jgi:hypothetical protein
MCVNRTGSGACRNHRSPSPATRLEAALPSNEFPALYAPLEEGIAIGEGDVLLDVRYGRAAYASGLRYGILGDRLLLRPGSQPSAS